jgi:superfamily II DNA or RNA helicase/HKD family nuclease
MMTFKDVEIKDEYRSRLHGVAKEFYIPLLYVAKEYKRAVGFFSSTVLCQIADGIAKLATNGGKIKIVASPYLSEKDIEAIKSGYDRREVAKKAVFREMRETKNEFEEKRLNLLANLIADDILDIKIAIMENSSSMGMYHEKMGIITDIEENVVAFSGSMNESQNALKENYEVIDVWCSWKSDEQYEKVEAKISAFTSIWNNTEPHVSIVEFPELKQEILDRYKRSPIWDYSNLTDNDNIADIFENEVKPLYAATIPDNVILHEYQIEAIDEWQNNNYCGIFDMATGTGKTFTGLGAVSRLCQALDSKLAVVIVCPYQHLVEQWVDDIEFFGINPIIGYSSSPQKNWLKCLGDAILNQKLKVRNREFFCFVCTNATFSTPKVQTLLTKIKGNALLIVDEAHNFGAERLSNLLNDKYNYRLALSATIERHNDPVGTVKLYDFFGKKCIEYSLERAIEEKKLTCYKYYPIITTLNEDELSVFITLTIQISKCLIKGKNGKLRLSERGKILALQRARLVAGISDKITKLEEQITPYVNDKHILVYCGATTLLKENQDYSDVEEDDLRQIDAVTDLLGNKLNMKVSQFTSKEDIKEREMLKYEFADGSNLQALIAIKCLDEGVNIPAIKTAFVLASTTNPKEYIQRRGRVLRLSEGKDYAEIYDFIALPYSLKEAHSLTEEQVRRVLSLIKNELTRAEEFSRLAMNMAEAEKVIDSIKEVYQINDYEMTEENYNYDEL